MLDEYHSELLWQTKNVEMHERGKLGTLRCIDTLSETLNFTTTQEFVKYIDGKDVVDVGSGLNGLAIDVLVRGLSTRVTSVNPAFTYRGFEQRQRTQLALVHDSQFPGITPEQIELARLAANQKTYPFYAHNMQLPDGTFDIAIDNAAVFYYADIVNSLALAASIEEMVRICKKGNGRIRVGDFGSEYGTRIPNWKEELLISMGIKFTPMGLGLEIFI